MSICQSTGLWVPCHKIQARQDSSLEPPKTFVCLCFSLSANSFVLVDSSISSHMDLNLSSLDLIEFIYERSHVYVSSGNWVWIKLSSIIHNNYDMGFDLRYSHNVQIGDLNLKNGPRCINENVHQYKALWYDMVRNKLNQFSWPLPNHPDSTNNSPFGMGVCWVLTIFTKVPLLSGLQKVFVALGFSKSYTMAEIWWPCT